MDTPALIKEICDLQTSGAGVMRVPLILLRDLLAQVAKRAIELNDKELNKLMIRMNLYELSIEDAMAYLES